MTGSCRKACPTGLPSTSGFTGQVPTRAICGTPPPWAVDLRQVNKRVLEALVQSGSMDSFGARRSQLVHALDSALEFGQKRRADREAGQVSLFGGLASNFFGPSGRFGVLVVRRH